MASATVTLASSINSSTIWLAFLLTCSCTCSVSHVLHSSAALQPQVQQERQVALCCAECTAGSTMHCWELHEPLLPTTERAR